jgi:hypothetical protein
MVFVFVLGLLFLICLLALFHHTPQPARQLVASVFLAIQYPFSAVQNALASAVSGLRNAATSVFTSVGSFHRAVGAFIHLVVFVLLSFCGLFLTLLTIAGLFGMELSWSPPVALETLSGFAFYLALAFLVAVLFEALLGVSHFGLWETIPSRIKPLVLCVLVALAVLGVFLIFWMGLARWHAMQLDDARLEKLMSVEASESTTVKELEEEIKSLATSPEEAETTKKVMVGLPLFIDTVAALAFSGAVLGLQVFGACVLWLFSVLLQILNIPLTVAAQVIEHIGSAVIAIVDFLHDLGRRLNWQEEPPQNQQLPPQQQWHQQPPTQGQRTSEQQQSSPVGQASSQQFPTTTPLSLANSDGNNSPLTALPGGEEGFPEPELTPIGATALDPLGLGDDHFDKTRNGGVR